MISVDYHESIGETDCDKNTNVEPTRAPTAEGSCEEPEYLESSGADVDLPNGAVQLLSNTGELVTFQISQLWDTGGTI
jgi:hypothetical protein